MAFNVQENAVFVPEFSKISHTLALALNWKILAAPRSLAQLRAKGPMPPLIGIKEEKKGSRGLVYATSRNLSPPF